VRRGPKIGCSHKKAESSIILHCTTVHAVTWRKGSCRIRELQFNTYCILIPLFGNWLLLLDEICRRSINFILSCLVLESPLIRFVATSAIVLFRNNSFHGHNIIILLRNGTNVHYMT
jgi:hypothetical protein